MGRFWTFNDESILILQINESRVNSEIPHTLCCTLYMHTPALIILLTALFFWYLYPDMSLTKSV